MRSLWSRRHQPASDPQAPGTSGDVPRHIAIIMDGNGRWAHRRGLPRFAGHHAGMSRVKDIIRACDDWGIACLTLYAFSTENWKRPETEVEYIMRLPQEFFRRDIDELAQRGVQVRFLGDTTRLPLYTQDVVKRTLDRTAGNSGTIVNFALNYGGRAEVVIAARAFAAEVAAGRASPEELSEAVFAGHLFTQNVPDPDLLIRTSGEIRLSNFLIWQAAYAELYFTDVLWPDFDRSHLHQAILDFQGRKRRFGGVN